MDSPLRHPPNETRRVQAHIQKTFCREYHDPLEPRLATGNGTGLMASGEIRDSVLCPWLLWKGCTSPTLKCWLRDASLPTPAAEMTSSRRPKMSERHLGTLSKHSRIVAETNDTPYDIEGCMVFEDTIVFWDTGQHEGSIKMGDQSWK